MVGSSVTFSIFNDKHEYITLKGVIVDAYTDITGSVSGKSENAFGFGSGKTTGTTESRRVYRVMHHPEWDTEKTYQRFTDVHINAIQKINQFKGGFIEEIFNTEKP